MPVCPSAVGVQIANDLIQTIRVAVLCIKTTFIKTFFSDLQATASETVRLCFEILADGTFQNANEFLTIPDLIFTLHLVHFKFCFRSF